MNDPRYDDPYGDPYDDELEGDYEDYDEAVRADIGDDIREILNWKEERDALAEKITPIDFEELPPVGDSSANDLQGNFPPVNGNAGTPVYMPEETGPGYPPVAGYGNELPPVGGYAGEPVYIPEETGPGYPPVDNYAGAPVYMPEEIGQSYPPVDNYAGAPVYMPEETGQGYPPVDNYAGEPVYMPEELGQGYPPVNVSAGAPVYTPDPVYAAGGYEQELSPADSYRNAGYSQELPPNPAPLPPDDFGQELRPTEEGYIPVENFSPEESYPGGPGYVPEGGGNPPPDGGSGGNGPGGPKRKRRKTSRPYLFVSYAFVAIFLLLIGNLVYFNIKERDTILASPYNRRQDDLAANVRRGSILASDGAELAVTITDELGNETRVYPYGQIFAHVVGYSTNGRSGLEANENVDLLTTHMDILERAERELTGKKAIGDNVVTTLSTKLQQTAWQALGDRRGAVLALNPKTGAVLAMVSKPDFDPNTIGESWNAIVSDPNNSCLLNRATQGLYVPGSTYKILTALAYYREHGTFDGYHYTCTGEITEGENTIHCAGGSVHGELDFTGAFALSCNCAFSDIGRQLGTGPLIGVMDSLLLGKTLPCPVLASKSRYDLSNADSTFRLMQTAFGQGGTSVTPWQMALIVSAIANGGKLMEPYLVDRVMSAEGKRVSQHSPKSYRQLLSEEEASALSGLLRAVVTSGSAVELAGFPVTCYGKTGSGEFTRSDGSRGTHAWFVGYAGVTDADVVFAVIAEDSGSGSDVAVPIAHALLNAYYS